MQQLSFTTNYSKKSPDVNLTGLQMFIDEIVKITLSYIHPDTCRAFQTDNNMTFVPCKNFQIYNSERDNAWSLQSKVKEIITETNYKKKLYEFETYYKSIGAVKFHLNILEKICYPLYFKKHDQMDQVFLKKLLSKTVSKYEEDSAEMEILFFEAIKILKRINFRKLYKHGNVIIEPHSLGNVPDLISGDLLIDIKTSYRPVISKSYLIRAIEYSTKYNDGILKNESYTMDHLGGFDSKRLYKSIIKHSTIKNIAFYFPVFDFLWVESLENIKTYLNNSNTYHSSN